MFSKMSFNFNEDLFPYLMASAACLGTSIYVYSKLFPKKKPAMKGQSHLSFVDVEKVRREQMEGTTDVSLLPKIRADELLSEAMNSSKQLFCQCLLEQGFAVLQLDKESAQLLKDLENSAWKYFALPDVVKDQNKGADRANLGYILVKGVREFIKLRPNDEAKLWPSPDDVSCFKPSYDAFFSKMYELVWKSFLTLAHNASDASGKPLLLESQIDAISGFVKEKSSVSLIHYFAQQSDNAVVCEEHKDTGLLTAVFRTSVPSLQIWHRQKGCYVKVEELVGEGEMAIFMGEKIPMFAQQTSVPPQQRFEATLHRVIVPPKSVDRLSIAFLLDVAK